MRWYTEHAGLNRGGTAGIYVCINLIPFLTTVRQTNRAPRRNSRARSWLFKYIENRKLSLSHPVNDRHSTVCGRTKTSGADIVDDSLQSTRTPTTTLRRALWRTRVDIDARPPDTDQINCERKVGSINAPRTPCNHGRKNSQADERVIRRSRSIRQSALVAGRKSIDPWMIIYERHRAISRTQR